MCAMSATETPSRWLRFQRCLKINYARVGRRAADDQARHALLSNFLQLIVIDRFRFGGNSIVADLVTDAGKVWRVSVSQMAAVRQVHPQNRVAIFERGQINSHVRLRATVRLHIRMVGAEQFPGSIDSSLLTTSLHAQPRAAVIAFLWIAFGVLVRKDRPIASRTASLTKFSEAISSRPFAWRATRY